MYFSPWREYRRDETFTKGRRVLPIMTPRLSGLPRIEQAMTFSVPRASHADFPEEAKVKTLLRSIGVLDEWLEQNEGTMDDEVRVRRMKRLRGEALQQLRLELNRTTSSP
jgi:hypothetical protein